MCASWLSLPINDQVVSLTFICLVMACLFVTVVLSVLTQREKLEHAIDPAKVAQGGIDADQRIDLICEQLAKRYGLTDRERQILGYLAVGRSLPYIRDELVLSKNTVDTHAKNLYRKLGIHSRQELIDLFDEGSGR